MDIQLKRGLLDVCVLAAIKSEDSYGYKIIKDLKRIEDFREEWKEVISIYQFVTKGEKEDA